MDLDSDHFLHQSLLDKSEWTLVRARLKNIYTSISWVYLIIVLEHTIYGRIAYTFNCIMMARVKFGIEVFFVLQYWADKAVDTLLCCYVKVPNKIGFRYIKRKTSTRKLNVMYQYEQSARAM